MVQSKIDNPEKLAR